MGGLKLSRKYCTALFTILVTLSLCLQVYTFEPESLKPKYDVSSDVSWTITSIDDMGSTQGHNPKCSIAIDSESGIHIAYTDHINGHLKYAYFDGSSWSTSIVYDHSDLSHDGISIDVDSNNIPYISYYTGYSGGSLNYAFQDPIEEDGWGNYVLDSYQNNVGAFSSIKIDSNDKAHIAYSDVENRDLKYISNLQGSTFDLHGIPLDLL